MAHGVLDADPKEHHMSTDKNSHPHQRVPKHVENSTDATRGQPLGIRAQKRKAELEMLLEKIPADELRARNDIEVAISTVAQMLTGDVTRLSDATAADLNRWLEQTKHLAEITPKVRPPRH
jgi:hypothetical protein